MTRRKTVYSILLLFFFLFFLKENPARSAWNHQTDGDQSKLMDMDLKLPHDVVTTCAKRDEPPSRRRLFRFIFDQNHILTTNSSERWPTSARHSVSSVFSVDCEKFVYIRVYSWLIRNDLVVALTEPDVLWIPLS